MDSLQQAVNNIDKEKFLNPASLNALTDSLTNLWNALNGVARNNHESLASNLVNIYRQFQSSLQRFEDSSETLERVLVLTQSGVEVRPEEGELILSLYDSGESFDGFLAALGGISSIYKELCDLLQISTATYPLRYRRIESGSKGLDLLGVGKVVELIKWLIERAAEFIYKRYTTDGKISVLSTRLETLEKQIGIMKQISAVLDEEEAQDFEKLPKEQLQKSFHAISTNISDLILRQHSIKVDGVLTGVKQESRERYLEHARQRLLEDRHTGENDEES